MVALAVGHPVKEGDSGHVAINSDGNQMANEHMSHKRSVQTNEKILVSEDHDQNIKEDIIQKRDIHGNVEDHAIEKRDAEVADEHVIQERDTQIADEGVFQEGDTQVADEHVIQERDTQSVDGKAIQDENVQEAWSNEGGYARQGEGGQYIYASDFGGPMVQILQHVYKANCCSCGCDCDCEGEGEAEAGEDGVPTSTDESSG